jgi:hypothetical protein
VLGFYFRNEYSAIRTQYIFSAVSIEEEEEEEEEEEAVNFFMLLSRILKEEPFQGDKCTLLFTRKNS